MWYLIVILVLLAGIFFTNKIHAQIKNESEKELKTKKKTSVESDTLTPLYTKEQIEEKLDYLCKTPPPDELSFGAMCYSVIVTAVKEKYTYVCPVCGEKTIYRRRKMEDDKWGGRKSFWALESGLNACRREVEKVKGINIRLDESAFCKHCSPKIEKHEICLLINIQGESDTTRVCDVDYEDIVIIQEFLSGQLMHKGGNDSKLPLVKNADRIKQLLGFAFKEEKD